MSKLLVLDNYDSFTYNLVHIVAKLAICDYEVFRNDKIGLDEVNEYSKILLSPGPGLPSEAGVMPELVKRYSASKSILGVCLGHQCIAESFGGKLLNLERPVHGKSSKISITDKSDLLFSGLPESFKVGRYHSWVVDKKGLPAEIKITALDESGSIMALSHTQLDVKGVQFHPESVMTEYGEQMIKNWLLK